MAKKSKSRIEYEKQYRRVTSFIRSAKKKGYEFTDLPNISKPSEISRITPKMVRELKELTPTKLYQKAEFVNRNTGEKISSATQRRHETSVLAGLKGQRTQLLRAGEKGRTLINKYGYSVAEVEAMTYQQINKALAKELQATGFSEGTLIYQQIETMINDVKRDHRRAGEDLMANLQAQQDEFGFDRVMRAIGQSPQKALELAELALRYNPADDRHDGAVRALWELISGEVLDAETSARIQDRLDEDEYYDGF